MEILQNAKNTPRYNCQHFSSMLSNAHRILNTYYNKTVVCPAYVVAVASNPGMKVEYFEAQWDKCPDAINLAKNLLNNMWAITYKGQNPSGTVLTQQDTPTHEVDLENPTTNTQQKRKFQTSFQGKR